MKKISILDVSIIIIIIQVIFAGLYRYEIITSKFIAFIPLIVLTLFISIFVTVVYFSYKIIYRGQPKRASKRRTNKRDNMGSS